MLIEIKNRWNGAVIFSHDVEENSIKITVAAAFSAKTCLSGCDLSGSNLRGCDLSGCNLSGCDLRGSNLRGCDLSGCNLSGCDLSGCDLSGCDLSGCNLSGCDLLISQIGYLLNAIGVYIK